MDEQIKKICVFYDTKTGFPLTKACKIKGIKHYSFNQTKGYNLSFIHLSDADLTVDYLKCKTRDCAIIIRRGAEKLEGGALHRIAAKVGGGGGLKIKSHI